MPSATDLIQAALGTFAGEFLQGRTRTVALYEGSITNNAPGREIGGNLLLNPHYTPSLWLEQNQLLKEYTTTPNTYRQVESGDDGAVISGFLEGNVVFDGTISVGKLYVLVPGDILVMETDGGQTEAIAAGDPISIDTIDTTTGTKHKHGCSVKRAAAGEVGWGKALNNMAALTAGLVMVQFGPPEYRYINIAVNGNVTVDIFPGEHAGCTGEIVSITHGITSGTPGEFNVANDGVDLHAAADITMVLTDEAMRPVPTLASTLNVTPLSKLTLDVNDAGTTCVDLMVTIMIRITNGGN